MWVGPPLYIPQQFVDEKTLLWGSFTQADAQRAAFIDGMSRRLAGGLTRLTKVESLRNEAPPQQTPVFIFQMSRCGSTLLATAADAKVPVLVLKEYPPLSLLSRFLRVGALTEDTYGVLLRGLVGTVERACPGAQIVFKCSSLETLSINHILNAFPCSQWAFLFRDPLEVIVSNRDRGVNQPWIFTPDVSGLLPVELGSARWCDVLAAILRRKMQAAIDVPVDRGGLYLEYPHWCDAVSLAAALGELGIEVPVERLVPIVERDAKDASRVFRPDGETKRASADPFVVQAAKTLQPLFDSLSTMALRKSDYETRRETS